MSNKERFSVLLRAEEKDALQQLSQMMDRSKGATVRTLIRQAWRQHSVPAEQQQEEKHELNSAA